MRIRSYLISLVITRLSLITKISTKSISGLKKAKSTSIIFWRSVLSFLEVMIQSISSAGSSILIASPRSKFFNLRRSAKARLIWSLFVLIYRWTWRMSNSSTRKSAQSWGSMRGLLVLLSSLQDSRPKREKFNKRRNLQLSQLVTFMMIIEL